MAQAKDKRVHIIAKLTGKFEVGITNEVLVNGMQVFSCITAAVYKRYFYLRVIQQYPDQFPACVPGSSNNSNFNLHD